MDSIDQIFQQYLPHKRNYWLHLIIVSLLIFAHGVNTNLLSAQCDSMEIETIVLKDIASEIILQHSFKVHNYTLDIPQPIPDSMLIKSFLGDLVRPQYIMHSFHPAYTKDCDSCHYVVKFIVDSLLNLKIFVQKYFKRIVEEDTTLLLTQYPIQEFLDHNKPTCWINVNKINNNDVNYSYLSSDTSIHWTAYGGNVLLVIFY